MSRPLLFLFVVPLFLMPMQLLALTASESAPLVSAPIEVEEPSPETQAEQAKVEKQNNENNKGLLSNPKDKVFWGTLLGGALAGGSIGALTATCACGLGFPLAAPIGLACMGSGTLLGAALASHWDFNRILFPSLLSTALGGVIGLAAGLTGLVTVNLASSILVGQNPSIDPTQANLINITSNIIAGVAAAAVMVLGAWASAYGVAALYGLVDESIANAPPKKKKSKKKRRKRRRRSAGPTPDSGEALAAMAF